MGRARTAARALTTDGVLIVCVVDASQSHQVLFGEHGAGPALAAVRPGGMLWVSWPKKASPLFRDLTEDGLREILLPTGWVDVKVCAVSADWSGLKFLRRRA